MTDVAAAPAADEAFGARLERRILQWALDPDVQRRLQRFPLTRPFARRAARRLFDLVAGFTYTQTLLAVLRLRLLEALREGPRDVGALAAHTGLARDPLQRLLDAAAAVDLVRQRRDGRWALGDLGYPLLARPEIAAMVEHDTLLYDDLRDPVALLRDPAGAVTRLGNYWAYATTGQPAALGAEQVADYSALMAATQPLVAADILDAYDVRRHRVLLDVGGGEGGFLCAAAARAPALRLQLMDLPAVTDRAVARFTAAGVLDRVQITGGDFAHDPLPTGADLLSFVRVLYDHPDARVTQLLAKAHAALAPGGTLLIGEPMSDLPGAEPVGAAYFGWYLLAMHGGRPRSPATYAELCRAAGFRAVRVLPAATPIQTGVVIATR